jgi:hypothetical protein
MKLFKSKYLWVITTIVLSIGYVVSCTKNDQVVNPASLATNILTSIKTASAPAFIEQSKPGVAWDGNIDPAWNTAPKLTVTATVPNPGNNTFPGFIGNSTEVTLRSMYDNQYIYFLAEWDAPKVLQSEWWYFDPVTKLWAQEGVDPIFDANGIMIRKPFVNDHFAMLWNINNSTVDFPTKTCYASCHVNTPSLNLDPVTGKITTVNVPGSVMRTNNINEKLDQWHIWMIQAMNFNQGNDEYQNWADGIENGDGMMSDDELPNATSGGANVQTLTITGTSTVVSVPMWVIPNKTNYNAILVSETVSGTALQVTAVDNNGVLTLNNGSTIDPTSGTDYQQVGAGDGPKAIPGYIFGAYTGSFADITSNVFYTGKGWRIQYKRLLKTADVLAQDVDFSSLNDQPFGIAAFFNHADVQHAIKTNLVLKFKK